MSRPSLNERLGIITAGIILVVVAAMLLYTRGPGSVTSPRPVPPAAADTVRADTARVDAALKEPGVEKNSHPKQQKKKGKTPGRIPEKITAPRSPLDEH